MCHSFRMNARTYPIKKKSKKSSMSPRLVVRMIRHWFAVSFFCCSRRSSIAAAPGARSNRARRAGRQRGQQNESEFAFVDAGRTLSCRSPRGATAQPMLPGRHTSCSYLGDGSSAPVLHDLTYDNDPSQLSMIKSGVGLAGEPTSENRTWFVIDCIDREMVDA